MELRQVVRQLNQLTTAVRSPIAAVHHEHNRPVDPARRRHVEHHATVAKPIAVDGIRAVLVGIDDPVPTTARDLVSRRRCPSWTRVRMAPSDAEVPGQATVPWRPAPAANRAAPSMPPASSVGRLLCHSCTRRRGPAARAGRRRSGDRRGGTTGERADAVRERYGARPGVAVVDDVLAEADAEALVGHHLATGEDEVEGSTMADEALRAHGPAVDQRDAPAPA